MKSDAMKVLIVDDEHLVRNLLKKCIDWSSLGMEIIGEASSGEDAIELTDKYNPDIVFTDICMANMDGIQFADYIIKKYPNIKVVVISGYDDFKYAQRSIKAGIKDYILKPINDEVVKSTALKLKKEIEQERETLSEYTLLKKQLIENKSFFVERLLNRLIQPDVDVNEIERQKNYLNFDFRNDMFQVIVIDIIFIHSDEQAKGLVKAVYVTKILEALYAYFKDESNVYLFLDMNYRITIIDNNVESIVEKSIEQIKMNILNNFNCIYSIGIGTKKSGMKKIEKSYKEALKLLDSSKVKKPNKLIDDIKKYIKSNLSDSELSLGNIAKIFFINPSYLSRTFKKNTRMNLMDYIIKVRIEEAITLLENTDLKAYEIGERVGIPDSSYFSTCFRKHTGISISEYKKR